MRLLRTLRPHRHLEDRPVGMRAPRRIGLVVVAAALVMGVVAPAGATSITSPGGGESFNIHPGDSFRVGYDFTIPGNNQAVTVKWTNPKAVVNFTCPNGTSGSFTIHMPNYTVTVSDSQWYPSGDQHSPLVYQGSITAPDGCGNGQTMHQNKIATFTADVTSSPANVPIHYRFHDVDNNASGSWSSTNSVSGGLITQTIMSEIYSCVNGAPSTNLVSGGSITVPAAGLSSPNPLPPTQVGAGTYTVNASAPSGFSFVACGQSGVTIASPSSAHQPVTVPSGGAGDGKFYVVPVVPSGYIEICKSSANGVTGSFVFNVSGISVTVPAGACSGAFQVPAGNRTVHENARTGFAMVSASTSPSDRLVSVNTSTRDVVVTVVPGDISTQTIVTFVNQTVTGTLEICKSSANGVTGSFVFNVSGVSVTVPAGACSAPFQVPAGNRTVHENARTGYGLVSASTNPSDRLVSVSTSTRDVVVTVVPGDISTQTIVTFVNQHLTGTLKVCQVAGTGVATGASFGFTNSAVSGTTQVPAGPAPGGYCVVVSTSLVQGTNVTISQVIPAGDTVTSIGVAPSTRLVGTPDLSNGKVTVTIGSGVTEVTYTDGSAA